MAEKKREAQRSRSKENFDRNSLRMRGFNPGYQSTPQRLVGGTMRGLGSLGRVAGTGAAALGVAEAGQNIMDASLPTPEENKGMGHSMVNFLSDLGLLVTGRGRDMGRRDVAADLFSPENVERAYGRAPESPQTNLNMLAAQEAPQQEPQGSQRTIQDEDLLIQALNQQLDPVEDRAVIAQRAQQSPQAQMPPGGILGAPTPEPEFNPNAIAQATFDPNGVTNAVNSMAAPQVPQMSPEQQILSQLMGNDNAAQPAAPEKKPSLWSKIMTSIQDSGSRYLGQPTNRERQTREELQQEELRRSKATPDPMKAALLDYALGGMNQERQAKLTSGLTREQQIMQYITENLLTGGRPKQDFEAEQAALDRQSREKIASIPLEQLAQLEETIARLQGGQGARRPMLNRPQ